MTKTCRQCQIDFEITNEDLAFYDKVSPVFPSMKSTETSTGKKYLIPPPTRCPDCRNRQRMAFRNESRLYPRTCALTNQPVLSIYHPQSPFTVYKKDAWQSSTLWDPLSFGRSFDFTRPFTEQFLELMRVVPRPANNIFDTENSDYCNQVWHIKNSYLCFNAGYCQDCYYCHETFFSKNCLDCLDVKNSELCYGCYDCDRCYLGGFLEHCANCSDAYYSYDCRSCHDIFLCSGLRNKQYCLLNQQYTKEEYVQKISELRSGSLSVQNRTMQEFMDLKLKAVHNQHHNIQVEQCTGDYLVQCKNCASSYNAYKSQDCQYVYNIDNDGKDSQDISYGAEMELCYSGTIVAGSRNHFGMMMVYGNDNLHCQVCENCSNCFGCIGLIRKQHCIFNQQYTKEEYEALVPKIIEHMQSTGEWGEFFPPSLSPFGYNETVANEYYPLTKEEALAKGFSWSDYEPPPPKVDKVLTREQMKKLPDAIKDIPDDILDWVLTCEVSNKPYRIIKQELQFYREQSLPIPRRHPDQRHKDRMVLRNPRKLWTRQCDCTNAQHQHERVGTTLGLSLQNNGENRCSQQMQTTYAPDRPEIVYCEECYLKEMY